jgi:hypothetical protein
LENLKKSPKSQVDPAAQFAAPSRSTNFWKIARSLIPKFPRFQICRQDPTRQILAFEWNVLGAFETLTLKTISA